MKRGAEGGDSYGSSAKRYGKGKGGSSGAGEKGVPRTRHAFKVLLTDNLTAGLLGKGGAMKDEIQNETNTKLVFSSRNDYFPGTSYRVLGVYADEPMSIIRAFEWILPKIVDLGEEERKNPPKDGTDLLGKEPGEYIFRFCVTKRMSSHIIGTGGANIKQIRTDTGAKVFIDNDTHLNHRLCRVIGTPEQILPCMEQVNEYVQQECDEKDFFSGFAGVINFCEAAASSWTPPSESRDSWSKGESWSKGGGGGERREGLGIVVPPPKGAKGGGAGESEEPIVMGTVQEEADGLAETLNAFPGGTERLQYSVSCELPAAQVGALLQGSGEFIKYVEEATATNIDIEGEDQAEPEAPRPTTIVGQLLNCYTAHAMMLMKLRTLEAQEQEAERRRAEEQSEDPSVLKARIEELQAQLAKVSNQLQGI